MLQENWDSPKSQHTCADHKYYGTYPCPVCTVKPYTCQACLENDDRFGHTCKPTRGEVSSAFDTKHGESNTLDKSVSFKLDEGKPRVGLVLREVPHAIEKLGTVLGFGAEKYSVGNWKKLEDIEGRFLDSLMRHLVSYHKGQKVDPESGESHLAHAFFNIAILLEQELRDEVHC